MTATGGQPSRDTVAAMRDTAVELEASEQALHRTADQARDADTAQRLHILADEISQHAIEIRRRARDLHTEPPRPQ